MNKRRILSYGFFAFIGCFIIGLVVFAMTENPPPRPDDNAVEKPIEEPIDKQGHIIRQEFPEDGVVCYYYDHPRSYEASNFSCVYVGLR
jgi:hypothetical protein